MQAPMAIAKQPQINAAIADVVRELSPSVLKITYNIDQDWTGEWGVFFLVLLSDEVVRTGFKDIVSRVVWRTTDRLDLPSLGLFPYFDFRSESEQAKRDGLALQQ